MKYENIDINSQEYKNLSTADKLKVVRFKLDELFKEEGKHKITVVYNGEKKEIGNKRLGEFRTLVEREKKLIEELKNSNSNGKPKEENANSNGKTKEENANSNGKPKEENANSNGKPKEENANSNGKPKEENANSNGKPKEENANSNGKPKEENANSNGKPKEESSNDFNFLKAYLEKEIDTEEFKNLSYEEKMNIIKERKEFFQSLMNKKENNKDVVEVLEYLEDVRVNIDIERISGNIDKKNAPKSKKNSFLSRIKSSFKKRKTRIVAGVCAVIIALTGFAGLKSCNNKGSNVNPRTPITSVTPTTNPTVTPTVNPVNNNDKNDVKQNDTTKEVEDNNIDLNDTVTIIDDSSIYTNSYDASYEYNPCNALYDGAYERNVEGLSYELNGTIYTIYQNDENAVEKVNMLVQSGAVLKAVLVTRTDLANGSTYEGYYNASNVRVRVR